MSIHKRISETLKCKSVSQKELCTAIGVAPSTLNNWLKYERSIPPEYLIPICEFLTIDIHWLLAGDTKRKEETLASTDNLFANLSPDEHAIGQLSLEEKLLIENYRDMKEKDKIDVQRNIARKLSKDERTKSTTCPNTKGDMEVAEDIG